MRVRKGSLQRVGSEPVRAYGSALAEEHDQNDDADCRDEADQEPPAGLVRVVQAPHAGSDAGKEKNQSGDHVKDRHVTENRRVENARHDVDDSREQKEVPVLGALRPENVAYLLRQVLIACPKSIDCPQEETA